MNTATLARFVAELKTAKRLRIDLTRDFHTLSPTEVSEVIHAADLHDYSKPRGANGSRARYFHARLQRAAQRRNFSAFGAVKSIAYSAEVALIREHTELVLSAELNWKDTP